jgi:Trk K+ transport system NAD-binding subunit
MDQWVDPVLFFAAMASIPMVIVQTGNPSDGDSALITGASWVIWCAFTANFLIRLIVAVDRRAQFHAIGWDLILIVGQPLYAIGPRKADAFIALLRLLVVLARSLRKGQVLRRTTRKMRTHPLRVIAFIVPFLWLLTAALIFRTETDSGVIGSFGDGLWWSAVTMATVGYGDISPKTSAGRAVAILTMVGGIGMFSVITAKLAELLFIQRARGTRKEILERQHTLILGWSTKIYTIVEQLVAANAGRPGTSIVVMANRDHNDMLDDITSHVPALARSRTAVATRSGLTSDPQALAIARPDLAKSIIIVNDDEEDASVVRTVLALMHGGAELPAIPIVAEMDDPAAAEALRLAMDGKVTVVNPTLFIARTAAQACRSAGVALTYENLLQFDGASLHLRTYPEATGRTFGELLTAFPQACLVGHRSVEGRADLNPRMETVVEPGDELLLLAHDEADLVLGEPHDHLEGQPDPPRPPAPEHVVIFGWNALCPMIVRELDSFVPPGSLITVAIDPELCGDVDPEAVAGHLVNATITVHRATDIEYAERVELIAESDADHAIVVCYRKDMSVAESDAHSLVTTLQVRHALEARGRDTTVVTELLDQTDVALAPPTAAGDVIVSDKLISLVLTQLSENAHLSDVFDDLLDPSGAELHSKPAARYCRPGVPTSFGAIVAAAGRHEESAIGYRRVADAFDAGAHFGAVLNPPKSDIVTLAPEDQVIVVADHDAPLSPAPRQVTPVLADDLPSS